MICRTSGATATALVQQQAQALDVAQAHMMAVSEQVSVAELATELAEARASFMERASGITISIIMYPIQCIQCSASSLCSRSLAELSARKLHQLSVGQHVTHGLSAWCVQKHCDVANETGHQETRCNRK